jgi:hypothetical protein
VDREQLDGIIIRCGFSIEIRQSRIQRRDIDCARAVLLEFAKDLEETAYICKTVRGQCRIAAKGQPCALNVCGEGGSTEREYGLLKGPPRTLKELLSWGAQQLRSRCDKFRDCCFTISVWAFSCQTE